MTILPHNSLNNTFIDLLQRSQKAEDNNDDVSSIYNIISKILSSRSKKVMAKLIALGQGSLPSVHRALQSVLISVAVAFRGSLCNIDLTKENDHVNWEFLEYMH